MTAASRSAFFLVERLLQKSWESKTRGVATTLRPAVSMATAVAVCCQGIHDVEGLELVFTFRLLDVKHYNCCCSVSWCYVNASVLHIKAPSRRVYTARFQDRYIAQT